MKAFALWLLPMAVFAAGWIAGSLPAVAAETSPPAEQATTEAGRLIEQLDAQGFAERQEASRKLSEAGKSVFPELEKAAESGSREVASRAVEVFKRHFIGGDDETKQSARAALERLAKSSNASAAQGAQGALNPQPVATLPQPNINGINPALIPLMQQRGIQIQVGGGPVRRTSIRNTNGKREIEIQDGDKVTKVRDGANGGIEAQTTEKVNGKETTRKVEAKDLDDLKQKDAEAARIYEQYTPRAGLGDIRQRQLESLDRSIERFKAQLPGNPGVQRTIDQLEQMKQQFRDQLPRENGTTAQRAKALENARQSTEAAQKAAEDARKAAAGEPKDPFAAPPETDPFKR